MIYQRFCGLALVLCPFVAGAQAIPWSSLFEVPAGSGRAESSSTRQLSTDSDSETVAPGETTVLADIEGPGLITRISTAVHSEEPHHRRLLLLRMYWDHSETPSVVTPLGDFFGVGYGLEGEIASAVAQNASGGRTASCYWPMPFRKHARITLTNEGSLGVDAIYYSVAWEHNPDLPRRPAYFHAHYRQEMPTTAGDPYIVADIDGRGRYVGTVLSVRKRERGWWGEGDPHFFVDGDVSPTIRGTGTDDYFGQTGGLRMQTGLYTGAPFIGDSSAGSLHTMYRWHIHDAIPFRKSLRVEFEHRGYSESLAYQDRADDFTSVAFWYQLPDDTPLPDVPAGYERLHVGSLIDGVMADTIPMDEKEEKLRDYLTVSAIHSDPAQIESPNFRSIPFEITLENTTSMPLQVAGAFPEIAGVSLKSDDLAFTLAPGSTRNVAVTLHAENGAADWRAINAIATQWKFTYPPPYRDQVETTVRHFLKADAPYACEQVDGVEVDGDLRDWAALPFVVRTPQQVRVQYRYWEFPEDCNFRFAAGYDDEYLYLAVATQDDGFLLSPMEDPWWQDGIEIRIDARPDEVRDTWNGPAGEFDEFIFFALTPHEEGEPAEIVQPDSLPPGTKYASVRTNDGYNTEIAVPHAALDSAQGESWKRFRLNIAINDLDSVSGPFSQIWWRPDWRYAETYDASGTFHRR